MHIREKRKSERFRWNNLLSLSLILIPSVRTQSGSQWQFVFVLCIIFSSCNYSLLIIDFILRINIIYRAFSVYLKNNLYYIAYDIIRLHLPFTPYFLTFFALIKFSIALIISKALNPIPVEVGNGIISRDRKYGTSSLITNWV